MNDLDKLFSQREEKEKVKRFSDEKLKHYDNLINKVNDYNENIGVLQNAIAYKIRSYISWLKTNELEPKDFIPPKHIEILLSNEKLNLFSLGSTQQNGGCNSGKDSSGEYYFGEEHYVIYKGFFYNSNADLIVIECYPIYVNETFYINLAEAVRDAFRTENKLVYNRNYIFQINGFYPCQGTLTIYNLNDNIHSVEEKVRLLIEYPNEDILPIDMDKISAFNALFPTLKTLLSLS